MPTILRQTMTNQDIVLSYWFRPHHIPVISCDILISSFATAITHCWSCWIVKIQQLDFPLLQPPIFGSGRLHTSPPGETPGRGPRAADGEWLTWRCRRNRISSRCRWKPNPSCSSLLNLANMWLAGGFCYVLVKHFFNFIRGVKRWFLLFHIFAIINDNNETSNWRAVAGRKSDRLEKPWLGMMWGNGMVRVKDSSFSAKWRLLQSNVGTHVSHVWIRQ